MRQRYFPCSEALTVSADLATMGFQRRTGFNARRLRRRILERGDRCDYQRGRRSLFSRLPSSDCRDGRRTRQCLVCVTVASAINSASEVSKERQFPPMSQHYHDKLLPQQLTGRYAAVMLDVGGSGRISRTNGAIPNGRGSKTIFKYLRMAIMKSFAQALFECCRVHDL